jgi:hypothetical protein
MKFSQFQTIKTNKSIFVLCIILVNQYIRNRVAKLVEFSIVERLGLLWMLFKESLINDDTADGEGLNHNRHSMYPKIKAAKIFNCVKASKIMVVV